LAVFTFELLTRKRRHVLNEPLPSQFSYLQGFFLRALHPKPEQRFENAVQMQAALSGTKKAVLPIKLEFITPGNAANN